MFKFTCLFKIHHRVAKMQTDSNLEATLKIFDKHAAAKYSKYACCHFVRTGKFAYKVDRHLISSQYTPIWRKLLVNKI